MDGSGNGLLDRNEGTQPRVESDLPQRKSRKQRGRDGSRRGFFRSLSMKIHRFVGETIREIMKNITKDFGPDAVILSKSTGTGGQLEVVAALDYDENVLDLITQTRNPEASKSADSALVAAPSDAIPASNRFAATDIRQSDEVPVKELPSKPIVSAQRTEDNESDTVIADLFMRFSRDEGASLGSARSFKVDKDAPVHPLVAEMLTQSARTNEELSSLRSMLEAQLASLAWNDAERRDPQRARILRELTRMNIEPDVAQSLVDRLPKDMSITPEQARYFPMGLVSRSLKIVSRDESEQPSVIAMVGPTGVGKTTTLAKLAAKAVLAHGSNNVALISTDHFRIGAKAQLEHYGNMLGVRVLTAYDADDLRATLDRLSDFHTVLVDTAGIAAKDERLAMQLAVLKDGGQSRRQGREMRAYLAIAANAQAAAIHEAVNAYKGLDLKAVILTKLDETLTLGGALSVLIRHQLPVAYVTNGQHVPADIKVANGHELALDVTRAMKEQAEAPPTELVMSERFGRQLQAARA